MTFMNLFAQVSEVFLIVLGLIFWLWGTLPILNKKHSLFYKLHTLTVSDTVGSLCMLLALVIHSPSNWVLLLTAAISLSLWNTFFSYILGSVADR
jgi:multicomponent Na+:H+ antiporter subunit G